MTTPQPDPDSLLYAQYWEPVLAGPAHRVLDRVGGPASESAFGTREPVTLLDLGAGTGSLTLAVADAWPAARIVSLDASAGMLSVARHRVATERPDDDPERFEWLAADGASMPLADASVDVVVSSFVLQLVSDRRAVFGEVLRVLRPGGAFGFVTWIAGKLWLGADAAFEEVLEELSVEEPESSFRPGRDLDFETLAEARSELEEAGFTDVDVRPDQLDYSWTPDAYLVFKEAYDERELFESLSADERARLKLAVRSRWAELPEGSFSVEAPLVSAVARRAADG